MSNTKQILIHFFGPKAIWENVVLLMIFSSGFLVGHLMGFKKAMDKYQKKEVINQLISTNQIASVIQNKIEANQADNSSYTEKFFNRKGVLVHEIEKTHENRASDLSFTNHTDLSEVNSQVTSATFATTEERAESTWLLGFSIPLKFHPDFQDMNAQIGYRLLGPIYVTGQTDYRFSEPRVGFLINF